MNFFTYAFKIGCYILAALGIYEAIMKNINLSILCYCMAILAEGFALEDKIDEKKDK